MNQGNDDKPDEYRAEVDQQDGGPGVHTEDASGGDPNDVASGGISERRNDDNDGYPDRSKREDDDRDVHGDRDTVS